MAFKFIYHLNIRNISLRILVVGIGVSCRDPLDRLPNDYQILATFMS